MPEIIDRSQLPAAILRKIQPCTSRPDLSPLDHLQIGQGFRIDLPGLNPNDLTRAANNIRNRALRRGRVLGMSFTVHLHNGDSAYVVRVA